MKGMTAEQFEERYGYDPNLLEWLDPATVLRELFVTPEDESETEETESP